MLTRISVQSLTIEEKTEQMDVVGEKIAKESIQDYISWKNATRP